MEGMIRRAGARRSDSGIHRSHFPACVLPMIFALFLLVSCAGPDVQKSPAKGVYHIVKKGETAYRIARAYSISLQDLAEANNITDISIIKEGFVIFIPDADQVIEDVMVSPGKAVLDAKRDDGLNDRKPLDQAKPSEPAEMTKLPKKSSPEKPVSAGVLPHQPLGQKKGLKVEEKQPVISKKDEIKPGKGKFIWPVKGTVKTRFGIQPNKTYHNNSWIKIVCPAGTQVKAAAGGTVIYSTSLKSSLKSFGETIIIRHDNDFATVYTHLKKRYVKQDQNVKKGQVIALVGEIDEAGDAYINFEIRYKSKPRDPLSYLP
ncbi:MAG: hypothetical protein CVU71_05720 [Deltaproteobacteria bacterium HGW-Deltaproteobacteria-6]|jgi:lipoprotein NlpD|nr:MAG: hypothetical protein CVU71_05720 [Deltaproteobacteria bacterium HGW-Deltaproteobacteria-6]